MKKITLSVMLLIALLLVPGVILAAEGNVAKIGDTEYATLPEAIAAVPNEGTATITLLRDVEDGGGFKIGKKGVETKNITIDFAGHTYDASVPLVGSTGTETNGCQLNEGSNITFKNGTLTSSTAQILIQNYSNLTIENMVLSSSSAVNVLSNNCGKVEINGNTSIKGNDVAINVCWWPSSYPAGAQVTINTTGTIEGAIEVNDWGTLSGTVKNTLTIENANHVGEFIVTQDYLKEQVNIEGGTFSSDVTEYNAEGTVGKEINGSFVFGTENKINVATVENGTISVDKEKAIVGETVTVTAKANDGYELKSITVTTNSRSAITVKDNKFVMPDGEVTVSAEFSKVVESTPTNTTGNADEKDETPKTGVETTFTVFTVLAVISLAGLALIKKSK